MPRLIMLLLEAHQHVDPRRVDDLHVRRPATIEVTILLDQDERIARPVLALGLDHIEVAEEEDGFGARIAAGQDGDHAAVFRMLGRGEIGDVRVGKTGGLQARAHLPGGHCAASARQGGVGLDKLLVDRAEAGLIGPEVLRHGGLSERGRKSDT